MTQNLSDLIDNYALFLPAIDDKFAAYIVGADDDCETRPVGPADLNFLNPQSRLWTYKSCLASAGRFAYSNKSNAITRRHPGSSWVMGDSGGYQVGTGAVKEIKGWKGHARTPEQLAQHWRKSSAKRNILRWLDAHCDYAMTLDMPLWARDAKRKETSPWHYCDVELLADLTVENLRFISDHRGLVGRCRFLNVLQGETEEEEDYWYGRVRDFEFEGWALGGNVGSGLTMQRVLRRLLLLRDQGMLGGPRQWFHVLGVSQLIWAVAFTAMQRAIQATTGSPFTISFDSSTPFLWAGRFQRYPKPPRLTAEIASWRFSNTPFPVGYAAATKDAHKPFPAGSPLSTVLTLGDMNPKASPYAAQTFGAFSGPALCNHNAYVFIRAFIDANKAAYGSRCVPQEIADLVGLISDLFQSELWDEKLATNAATLDRALRKARANTPDQGPPLTHPR